MSQQSDDSDETAQVKLELDTDTEMERIVPLRVGVDVESQPMDEEHGQKKYTVVVPPWDVLSCAVVSGGFPIDGKAFPGRAAAEATKELSGALGELKAQYKLVAFGHCDTTGSQPLSEKAARAIVALATNDVADFKALADDDGWGIDVIQYLVFYAGHSPGPLDGIDGPKTQGGIKAYQKAEGLEETGKADSATKDKLYTNYLKKYSPQVKPDLFHDPKFAGCGSDNPLADVDGANLQNRRVVVFAFKAPRLPTVPSGGELKTFYEKISKECSCEDLGPTPVMTTGAAKKGAKSGAPFMEDCDQMHEGS